jgi:predicted RNase H-like HicB family nuclease
MHKIIAYIERDPETGLYIGTVHEIVGAHTQAETLDELQKNLKEVIELCLEEMTPEDKKRLPEFIGIQQIEVSV